MSDGIKNLGIPITGISCTGLYLVYVIASVFGSKRMSGYSIFGGAIPGIAFGITAIVGNHNEQPINQQFIIGVFSVIFSVVIFLLSMGGLNPDADDKPSESLEESLEKSLEESLLGKIIIPNRNSFKQTSLRAPKQSEVDEEAPIMGNLSKRLGNTGTQVFPSNRRFKRYFFDEDYTSDTFINSLANNKLVGVNNPIKFFVNIRLSNLFENENYQSKNNYEDLRKFIENRIEPRDAVYLIDMLVEEEKRNLKPKRKVLQTPQDEKIPYFNNRGRKYQIELLESQPDKINAICEFLENKFPNEKLPETDDYEGLCNFIRKHIIKDDANYLCNIINSNYAPYLNNESFSIETIRENLQHDNPGETVPYDVDELCEFIEEHYDEKDAYDLIDTIQNYARNDQLFSNGDD